MYCRNLFNAAFVSCWSELSEEQQDELVTSLEQALKSQNIQQITQTLLNLSEFMEHCEIKGTFSLSIRLLGECASKCRAYAKALHYKEEEFQKEVTTEVLESLIRFVDRNKRINIFVFVFDKLLVLFQCWDI